MNVQTWMQTANEDTSKQLRTTLQWQLFADQNNTCKYNVSVQKWMQKASIGAKRQLKTTLQQQQSVDHHQWLPGPIEVVRHMCVATRVLSDSASNGHELVLETIPTSGWGQHSDETVCRSKQYLQIQCGCTEMNAKSKYRCKETTQDNTPTTTICGSSSMATWANRSR